MSSKKIPVSEKQQPLASNPFAGLELQGLPLGEDKSEVPSASVASKFPKSFGRVVLRREKARRSGKTVVVVSDFAPHFRSEDLEAFARKAKQACGCGGTVAGREIELQGDEPTRVRRFFEAEGFRVDGV